MKLTDLLTVNENDESQPLMKEVYVLVKTTMSVEPRRIQQCASVLAVKALIVRFSPDKAGRSQPPSKKWSRRGMRPVE